MFVYVCFLVRYYYVECTDFMYDSIKILKIILNIITIKYYYQVNSIPISHHYSTLYYYILKLKFTGDKFI